MRNLKLSPLLAAAAAAMIGLLAFSASAQTGSVEVRLKLEPFAAQQAKIDTQSVGVPLTTQKPAGLVKEPTYRATPKYAVLHVGNGPRSTYILALDEPANDECRLYVDRNHNGDLTADGDVATMGKLKVGDRTVNADDDMQFQASWGTSDDESSAGYYGLSIRHDPAESSLQVRSLAARVGAITLNGQSHKVMLIENDGDGLYSKPVALDDAGKPASRPTTQPVWLLADLGDTGSFGSLQDTPQQADVRGPFRLAGVRYSADIAPDGSHLTLLPTSKPVADLTDPADAALKQARLAARAKEREAQAEAGRPLAPDFTALSWGGGNVKLSDFRGKIVVVDFWATWCGPCQMSMPHLEKVYRAVQGRGDVVVLGVCSWDDQNACAGWIPQHPDYTFKIAFDPAAKNGRQSIATRLFGVHGIPDQFVIDRQGHIAAEISGFRPGDHRLEDALKSLGVVVSAETASLR